MERACSVLAGHTGDAAGSLLALGALAVCVGAFPSPPPSLNKLQSRNPGLTGERGRPETEQKATRAGWIIEVTEELDIVYPFSWR